MLKFNRLLMLLVGCFCLVPTSWAVVVKGLYQASIPVASQNQSAQAQAEVQGLQQVLVKVSGNPAITSNSVVTSALNNAANLMQSYSFNQAPATPGQNNNPLLMQINYDPTAVNALLQQANQPLWGSNRPLVMVWMAIDDGLGPQLVSSTNNGTVPQLIQQNATDRGLPIMLPMFDLQDMQAVTVNDVWNNVSGVIAQASQRYGSDVELIGRVSKTTTGQWNADWTLMQGSNHSDWQTSGDTVAQVVSSALNTVVHDLTAQYASQAPASAPPSKIRFIVTNAAGANAYAQIVANLKNLNPVRDVQVVQIGDNQIVFELAVVGGQPALTQALAMDHQLTPMTDQSDQSDQPGPSSELEYQWTS